ncbi:MAG TPA: hypothetical protein VFY48_10400 [Solirubrobacterales bacterium]|nr:hypothetical protein [Solirubrobacterales bacterium]
MALAAMVPMVRQPQAPAAGYEEFNGCPHTTDCELSAVEGMSKEMREIIKSTHSPFIEPSIGLWIEPDREIVLGNNCYVGELTTPYSAPTESTSSFYEQTQLNSCLA